MSSSLFDDKPVTGETLWHYTSPGGMAGIVQNLEIWCTELGDLNDRSEGHHSVRLLRQVVRKMRDRARPTTGAPDVFQAVLDHSALWEFNTHVASFCLKGDRLDSWRAYASGGRGFALGFSGTEMEQRFAGRLVRCRYADAKTRAQIRAWILDMVSPRVLRLANEGAVDSRTDLRCDLQGISAAHLRPLGIRLKHPAFVEEDEVRLWAQEGDEQCGEICDYDRFPPIRRLRLGFPPTALREVMLGPFFSVHADRRRHGDIVRSILSQAKLSDVRVTFSKVPLRAA